MPNYIPRKFALTMDGTEKQVALYGIYSPTLKFSADPNNLQAVYVGNTLENGDNGQIRPLNSDNNLRVLLPGQSIDYGDMQQRDRFDRTRNLFIENGFLHVLPQWYLKGSAGDIVFVDWLDENTGAFRNVTTGIPIDISEAGLSR